MRTSWVCSPSTAHAHHKHRKSICSGGGGGGGGRGRRALRKPSAAVFSFPGLVQTRLRHSDPRAPHTLQAEANLLINTEWGWKRLHKTGSGRLLTYAFLLQRSSWRGWDSRPFQNVTVDGDILIPLMQILKIHASFLIIRKMVPQRLVLRTTAVRVNSNNDLKGKLLICTISECRLFPQKC